MPNRTIEIEGRKYEVWFDYTKPDFTSRMQGEYEIYEIHEVDGFNARIRKSDITLTQVITELEKIRVKEQEEGDI